MFQKDFFLTCVPFYKITYYSSITQMIIYFLSSKIGSVCTSDKSNCSISKKKKILKVRGATSVRTRFNNMKLLQYSSFVHTFFPFFSLYLSYIFISFSFFTFISFFFIFFSLNFMSLIYFFTNFCRLIL